MQLNDSYESVRSQTLSMDPLPTVNKAYYIVQLVKVQKQVTSHVPEVVAFMVDNTRRKNHGGLKSHGRNQKAGNRKFVEHGKSEGHTFEQCFERIGYSEWYKGKRNKKMVNSMLAAQVLHNSGSTNFALDTPLETPRNETI